MFKFSYIIYLHQKQWKLISNHRYIYIYTYTNIYVCYLLRPTKIKWGKPKKSSIECAVPVCVFASVCTYFSFHLSPFDMIRGIYTHPHTHTWIVAVSLLDCTICAWLWISSHAVRIEKRWERKENGKGMREREWTATSTLTAPVCA